MTDQHQILQHQIVTLQDVERLRREAQLMQSRETARLARRLFGAPARLARRLRDGGRTNAGIAVERPRTV